MRLFVTIRTPLSQARLVRFAQCPSLSVRIHIQLASNSPISLANYRHSDRPLRQGRTLRWAVPARWGGLNAAACWVRIGNGCRSGAGHSVNRNNVVPGMTPAAAVPTMLA